MKNSSRFFKPAAVVLAVVLVAGCFWSCRAQGDSAVEGKGDFTELELHTGVSVTYVQGPYKPVKITGDKAKVALVEVRRKGNTLEICHKSRGRNVNINGNDVKITVQAPSVREFDLSVGATLDVKGSLVAKGDVDFDLGTGAVVSVGSISAPKIQIDCSTGAAVNLTGIKTERMEVDCSTGAVANLGGTVGYLEIDCGTGAVVNASGLKAQSGDIEAGTGAHVEVNIRDVKSLEKGVGAEVTNHAR